MIIPAISVLSAIEGVKVAAPSVSNLVIPITVAIIIALFLVQRCSWFSALTARARPVGVSGSGARLRPT